MLLLALWGWAGMLWAATEGSAAASDEAHVPATSTEPTVAPTAATANPVAQASAPSEPLLTFGGIEVEGLPEEVAQSARQRVSLWRLKTGTSIRSSRWRYLNRILDAELRDALEPFGFYNARWTATPQRIAQSVSLRIEVALGEPVRVRQSRVEVSGAAATDAAIGRRLERFRPAQGEPLRHAVYEQSKTEVQRTLADRGYFDATPIEARVEVTRALDAADIDLRWASGPRYAFGPVRFTGSPFAPDLLTPLLPFEASGRFHMNKLLLLQQRLAELDYFSSINIQPREVADAGRVDGVPAIGIDVALTPAPRNVYRTGASFGTDTGLAVNLGYDRRWINARGHKFQSDLLVGEQRSAAKLSYRVPAFEGYGGWWVLGLSAREEPFASVRSDVFEAALQREAAWRNNRVTLGLHVHRERFDDVGDTLVFPQISLGRTLTDDPLYPTRGFSWNLLARWAPPALGSEVEFNQWQADATLVRSLGRANRLILRGTAGAIASPSGSIEEIPPSFRFYAGGDRSVRGYGYQELGPRFEGDIRTGAKHLLTGSVEWEHMFGAEWGAALFVDAGNAFGTTFEPAVGAGLGLRWRSPVGPIRVDLAHGFDDAERSVRIHIQLGPEL